MEKYNIKKIYKIRIWLLTISQSRDDNKVGLNRVIGSGMLPVLSTL